MLIAKPSKTLIFGQNFIMICSIDVGCPSPVYHAQRLSEHLGGAQIYLKREDRNHTGAHKVNNTIGQALLARRMGKKRVIAKLVLANTALASATVAARFGMGNVM